MDDNEEKNQSTADMTQFVQDLLHQMQVRFQTMSENIVSKIDEMGSRIDELERSINDLKAEVGEEKSPSPTPSAPATGAEQPWIEQGARALKQGPIMSISADCTDLNNVSVTHFTNWLKAKFEIAGVACFMANQRLLTYQGLEVLTKAMKQATVGVDVFTRESYSNSFPMAEVKEIIPLHEELVPIFFWFRC